jgi:AraC-like DNA-binding protein
MLDIPTSVIYRWRALHRHRVASSADSAIDVEALATLIARCEELGFRVAERMRAANGRLRGSIEALHRLRPTRTPPDAGHAAATGAAASTPPVRGDGAGGKGGQPGAACDPPGSAQTTDRPAAAGQRYVFDACRERPERGVRSRLEAVRQAVDSGYFLDVDCPRLAEMASMSLHHFIRVFHDMFGVSPHQYLTRARVEAAKRLLLASSEPIEVIAVGVGFRSGPSLNRAFKRIEGTSVSRYCQAVKKGGAGRNPRAPVAVAAADGPRQAAG